MALYSSELPKTDVYFLFQQLSDKFRYHYSKLWLSIIDRNRDEMKIHAEELGIRKELYGLFACMVTGRPWDSIMKGIGRTRPTSDEASIPTRNKNNIFIMYIMYIFISANYLPTM